MSIAQSFSTTTNNPPSSSSSSSSSSPKKYDVFISSNGRDDVTTLASELEKELSNIGLKILKSDDELFKLGDYSQIIQHARHLVVVLTKSYVTSVRCLRELSKIIEEGEDYEEVIPVFYQDPSYLLKQLKDFGKRLENNFKVVRKEEGIDTKCMSVPMAEILTRLNKSLSQKRGLQQTDSLPLNLNHVEDDYDAVSEEDKAKVLMKVPRWKSALKEITNSSRKIVVTKEGHESDIINEVKEIIKEVKESSNLVGISTQLHQMDNLIELGSNDVRFIGIVGMGGIGKTAIAKALYENLEPKFRHNHCFLRVSGKKLVSMQNQLLSRLCGELHIVIKNENHGAQLIKNSLKNRKVLIVLDGVEERRQVEKLAGSPDWFSPGSRIIITTRNRDLCRQPKYKHTFEFNVEFLNRDDALSLFCKHAFKFEDHHEPPDENFKILAEELVKKVEGHPLALIKIGSHLRGKDINIWEEKISSIHGSLFEDLFHDILKTGYEGLDVDSQHIFLDLACFFHYGMNVDRVIEILESFGYRSPSTKLHLLAERNLIQISYDQIQIHTLVRFMGQEIALRQSTTQIRIWLPNHIRRAFQEERGLKHVEGVVLEDMEEENLTLKANAFKLMTKLKLLEINNNVKVNEEIPFLSNQLRLLHWRGYPSKYLPSTFHPPSLIELHLRNSQIVRLWDQKKEFTWLKEIDMSGSEYLLETPDFSKVPHLQRLILRNCERLSVVHPSIATLNHLVLVDMAGCTDLKTFPSNLITCKRLKTLILSSSGLECFPEIEKQTKSLTELHLNGTLIDDLPLSLGLLTHLNFLNLRDCTRLSSLPRSIRRLTSLETLNLNGCKNLPQLPSTLRTMQSLTMLDIGGTLIDQAPYAISSLNNLETLNCERLSRNIWCSLTALVGNGVLPLRDLNLSDCSLVDEDIPNDLKSISLLEILDLSKNSFVQLKESLTQLTNLKALYLNDCINIQPQLLPKLPQYIGVQNSSQHHTSQNDEGSYGSKSASSPPPNSLRLVPEIENVNDDEKEEYSHERVDNINVNMSNQISQLSTHSKIEVDHGKHLVGMEKQLEEVHALLDIKQSNEVRFVKICGMDGIGKTAIAKAVYDQIAYNFDSSCFLHISERKSNLVFLQRQLLSLLLQKEDIKVLDEDSGAQMIKNHMKSRMVLVVLDDIDDKRQVEVLVGSPDWFGLGSRVIITTRNKDILRQVDYKDRMREYEVKLLSQESAYLLFSKYAFGNYDGPEKKHDLCMEIVKKVGRLPLALKLIGSALHDKDIATWKETSRLLFNVEEDFLSTIANKEKQEELPTKSENVEIKNEMLTFPR